jgi:nicotinamidase-related amidase
MLKAASILSIPIYATTQNAARLGPTCNELLPLLENSVEHVDKKSFSMWVPEISQHFSSSEPSEVVIVGIESHICVTQTAIDLIKEGHKVYVLRDGVGSCNKEEVPIAMDRLRTLGVTVTSSESWIFECVGDAGIEEFKQISGLIKEFSGKTKEVMGTLCKI